MRSEPGAAGRTAGADPAGAWIEEWRRLLPPPGVWWRKSAFDLARARRTNRLRPWRWLTEPVATFRIWLATGRLSPAKRARWNQHAEAAAAADPLLSALDPHQRRAAVCFEDRAMVTAGAGTGRLRLWEMSGRTRHFAGCTNWNGGEGCDYTQPCCGACGTGMLVETPGGLFECSDPSCRSKHPGCRCRPPRPMVVRRQKRTQKRFWGCWRYGEADACGRTRPID